VALIFFVRAIAEIFDLAAGKGETPCISIFLRTTLSRSISIFSKEHWAGFACQQRPLLLLTYAFYFGLTPKTKRGPEYQWEPKDKTVLVRLLP
jgi:hypothetical protein